MTTPADKTADQLRKAVMALLSNKEIDAMSSMESVAHLDKGAEYVDLEELGLGVQVAKRGGPAQGRVLPRGAVADATWAKILALLAT